MWRTDGMNLKGRSVNTLYLRSIDNLIRLSRSATLFGFFWMELLFCKTFLHPISIDRLQADKIHWSFIFPFFIFASFLVLSFPKFEFEQTSKIN